MYIRPKLSATASAEDRGDREHAVHLPADRPRRDGGVVEGDRHDGHVVQQRQGDNHDRRQGKEPIDHRRQHDEDHDVGRHGDAVERVAHHAGEDPPRLLDPLDDDRQAGVGQDQAAAARAASVAPDTAMPTSACFRPGRR